MRRSQKIKEQKAKNHSTPAVGFKKPILIGAFPCGRLTSFNKETSRIIQKKAVKNQAFYGEQQDMTKLGKKPSNLPYSVKLRSFMELKGIAPSFLMRKINLSRAYFYGKLLAGKSVPSAIIVKRIEEALHIRFTSKDFE